MKKRLGAIALAFAMILVLGAYAVYGDSDITNDPLVSLSYINEVLWPEIEDMIERHTKKGVAFLIKQSPLEEAKGDK